MALAGSSCCLNLKRGSPQTGPGQAGHDPGCPGSHFFSFEVRFSQELADVVLPHYNCLSRVLGKTESRSAQDFLDLLLEPANSRLPGIAVDDPSQGSPGDSNLFSSETMGLEGAWNQVPAGNLQLLFQDVAGESDDFHAVKKGQRDRIHLVGRRDEENIRQIEGYIQIVVAK